jgi:hypothetical protein
MIKALLCLVLIAFMYKKGISQNDSCKDIYLDKVLSSWEYFVCIKTKIKDKEDSVLIKNGELRAHLIKKEKKRKFSDTAYYEAFLKNLISTNKPLKLTKKFYANSERLPVRISMKVDSLSKISHQVFIDHYFDKYGRLKVDEPVDGITWVIKILIDWNVFVSGGRGFDDEWISINRKQKICSN